MNITLQRSVGASAAALLASSATLVCCVLPAVLVSLGAGAVLVGLVSAIPQLIWLSEHKLLVFGIAGGMLILSWIVLRRAAHLPCPTEPLAGKACMRLRRVSAALFWLAATAYVIGASFVWILPLLMTNS
ncbi:hypothetical protein GCM10011487_69470 [Steroidobacter agaridevorans]|uniref:Mercuric transport protein MerT n=1 Tax=Steroidobacter agaridevorans TaxID=2695856 RepID=A0A829YNM6_9GAMM|nr:hypothetical protein [Steroidobacter agaridevorans]GFE84947.1 hypothetical protein GCM10011487_69470 [Steroidobacter agaridevorans]GFE91732.1 hypothetical protein GCM10011488_66860 [Steroidobacter agaridevorans]